MNVIRIWIAQFVICLFVTLVALAVYNSHVKYKSLEIGKAAFLDEQESSIERLRALGENDLADEIQLEVLEYKRETGDPRDKLEKQSSSSALPILSVIGLALSLFLMVELLRQGYCISGIGQSLERLEDSLLEEEDEEEPSSKEIDSDRLNPEAVEMDE